MSVRLVYTTVIQMLIALIQLEASLAHVRMDLVEVGLNVKVNQYCKHNSSAY